MRRRNFLKTTLCSAVAMAAIKMPGIAFSQKVSDSSVSTNPDKKADPFRSNLRGVNLGGWLVLEKWMAPDPYRDTDAEDEYSLCLALGNRAKSRLDHHRETFITAGDFRWIRDCGLNAVRLPVGYWALEAPKPFVESSSFIDFALDHSHKNGLKLLLDLHGAPGSQNGWDHSGRSGPINWPKDPQNIQETLRILDSFAQRYGKHPALFGIELLNEPRVDVPLEILQQFYQDAYARLRKYLTPNVAIVFHDAFRPFAWKNFMQGPAFANVIMDTHLYQCFNPKDKGRTAQEQLEVALNRKKQLDRMQREELPAIVGEWSLSLSERAMLGLSQLQVASVKRAYASTQLLNYEGTRGWFYWSYKLAHDSDWNFRYCVERGWLPEHFVV
jgi:glucan 1,3-beta-glucosidase